MSIESAIILGYLIGAGASYKFLSRMAMEKAAEEYRRGKIKTDTAYAVFAFAVLVSVALWPILLPMRLFEVARERIWPDPKAVKVAATKRSRRRR